MKLHRHANVALTVQEAILLRRLLDQYIGALWIQKTRRAAARRLRKKLSTKTRRGGGSLTWWR